MLLHFQNTCVVRKFVNLLFLLISIIYSQAMAMSATPGKDGVGGILSGVVNTYFSGVGSLSAGERTLTLGNRNVDGAITPITAGDLLLIIQMQGAELELADADLYGDGVIGDPANGSTLIQSGQHEFVEVISSNNVSVTIRGAGSNNGLVHSYIMQNADSQTGQYGFQIIRVPQYSTATTSSSLTAAVWNGTSGGVLTFDTAGQLTMSGIVDVSGLGFRGAGGRQLTSTSGDFGEPIEYRINAGEGFDNDAGKGEGIAGTPRYINQVGFLVDLVTEGIPEGSAGFGAPANAGGGGTNGTGGGGGANGGAGGRGGDNWSPTEIPNFKRHPRSQGGFGGARIANDLTRIYLGGGGGAGANRNQPRAHGGSGGGIVFLRAGSVVGTGTIRANGLDAPTLSQPGNAGNVGGGGAGGSVVILLPIGSTMSGLTVEAQGGRGASILGGDTVHAAGGGGGGGTIYLSGNSAITTVLGGSRGSSPAENQSNNGGTGQIPVSHLPTRGDDGFVFNNVDASLIPSLVSALPNVTVQVQALWSRVNLPGKVRYKIRLENAVGASNAKVLQCEGFGLMAGFLLEQFSEVTYGGLTESAVGPSALQNLGNNQSPVLSAASGIILPAGGWVEFTLTVAVDGTVPVAMYQRPLTVQMLDPQRTTQNGTRDIIYDAAASTQDDINTTLDLNQVPIARDDLASTLPNTAVVVNVLSNDTDPDGNTTIDVETVDLNPDIAGIQTSRQISAVGLFSTRTDGAVLFDPLGSFAGVATIDYTVSDFFQGLSNRASIRVTVPNTPPVAAADVANTPVETPVQLAVLLNDSDINGAQTINPASIDLEPTLVGLQTRVEIVGQGVFQTAPVGLVVFTPATGFSGLVSVEYVVADFNGGISNPATITINVSGIRNDPPVAVDDDAVTALELAVAIPVLLNDTDPNGQANLDPNSIDLDPASSGIQIQLALPQGRFSTSSTGLVTFTPATGFTGTLEIQYTVADRSGLRSLPAKIRVEVARPIGTVIGRVFADSNGNGFLDLGELGLGNISLNITDPSGNEQLIQTDARGEFSATVRSGNVTVDVREPSGSLPSSPDPQVVNVLANGRGQARAIGLVTPRLEVQVQVDRPVVQVGATTVAEIRLKNTGEIFIQALTLDLTAPNGFVFVKDSVMQNGKPLTATRISDQQIRITFDRLEANQQLNFTLRLGATPAARGTSAVQVRATGSASLPTGSLVVLAAAQSEPVQIEALNQSTVLLGRIYVDQNMNGQFDPTDLPLKGIRVLLTDGAIRITDSQGLYSFAGLKTGSTIIRVEGLEPQQLLFPALQDQLQPRTRALRINLGINTVDFRVVPNTNQVSGELGTLATRVIGHSWRDGNQDFLQIAVLDPQGKLVGSNSVSLQILLGDQWETRVVNLINGQTLLQWSKLPTTEILLRLNLEAPLVVIPLERFDGQVFGIASVQLGLSSQGFSALIGLQGVLTWQINADERLTIAINGQAGWQDSSFAFGGMVRQSNQNTDSLLLTGDASSGSRNANSDDPFYVRYEWQQNNVTYGQLRAGQLDGLSSYNAMINGLRWNVADSGLTIRGFAALRPSSRLSNQTPTQPFGEQGDGTSFYRLEQVPVTPESERVRIITRAKDNPNIIVREQELQRGLDYNITNNTGDIRLQKPLYPTDSQGNPQYVVIEYNSSVQTQYLDWQLGTQLEYQSSGFSVRVSAMRLGMDKPLFGSTALEYKDPELQGSLELAWSGDWGLSASGQYQNALLTARAKYQALGLGYIDPNNQRAGQRLEFSVTALLLPEDIQLIGVAQYGQSFEQTNQYQTNLQLEAFKAFSVDFGTLKAGLGYQGRFSNSQNNTGSFVVGSAVLTYQKFEFGLTQRIPVSVGTTGETEFSAKWAIQKDLSVWLQSQLVYAANGLRNQTRFGIDAQIDQVNFSTSYELPTLPGELGVARININAPIRAIEGLSFGFGGELRLSDFGVLTGSLETSLRYTTDWDIGGLRAGARVQYSVDTNGQYKGFYNLAGMIQISPNAVLAPNIEVVRAQRGDGERFSIAGAYRGSNYTVLGQLGYRNGVLSPSLNSDVTAEVHSSIQLNPDLEIRFSSSLAISELGLSAQVTVCGMHNINQKVGVGLCSGVTWQPNTATVAFMLAPEVSYQVLPAVRIVGGINFIGTSGFGTSYLNSGMYVRLDFAVGEGLFRR